MLKQVVALGDGFSFGELALLNSKPRAATIVCLEDCHFATLNRQDFDKIIKT